MMLLLIFIASVAILMSIMGLGERPDVGEGE